MGEIVSNHELPTDISNYYVEPLHNKPHLLNACCELINMEWKRSLEARKRSIEGSSENFPMSLLILPKNSSPPKVVGHCKITRIPFSDTKVFVQTVVIHPKLRGKGFGKYLMEEVEKVAKKKNIKSIYLTTDGQEGFYQKLGYTECPPISLYGSKPNNDYHFEKPPSISQRIPLKTYRSVGQTIMNLMTTVRAPPPPPPPPLPSSNVTSQKVSTVKPNIKTFMMKEIIL